MVQIFVQHPGMCADNQIIYISKLQMPLRQRIVSWESSSKSDYSDFQKYKQYPGSQVQTVA